ncbi:hypothetical protein ABZ930_26720 [Streptomyces sp. NPDC046716]|uniref:hypothetical protein n=1 Tax=Streptomyces sp. NPDC046716 TaxID=3157093 RepID=UPI0033E2BFFE
MEWITKNPDAFAAFVAALAIVGGLLGSYIGAKVQASSGRVQAKAATDAARITVDHQHLAAFHVDRRLILATFLHRAEAVRLALVEVWDDEHRDADAEWANLYATQAELELIAPHGVVDAALDLRIALDVIEEFVEGHGPMNRFLNTVTGAAPVFQSPEAQTAHQAVQMVASMRRGVREIPDALNPAALARARNEAYDALEALNADITPEDIVRLLDDVEERSQLDLGLPEGTADLERARAALVRAGRAMLGSDLPAHGQPDQPSGVAPRH